MVEITRYTTVDDVCRAINPMIVEGQTDGGIVPATAAVLNALCDALSQADVDDLPMPATAAVVWEKARGRGNL